MSYKVKLPLFEGPFDLLVYLIENARMSIYDIKISEITEQYLAYISEMQQMDISLSTEFMVLAATLIDIKSRMILPRNQEGFDDELLDDPRNELVDRILEYKKYKELSQVLEEKAEEAALIFDKPKEDISVYTDNPDEYLSLTLDKFVSAFELFLQREKRMAEVRSRYRRVERDKFSIEGRIRYIAARLRNAMTRGIRKMSLRELIPNKKDKYDIVVTFSSVLQMMKDKVIDAEQKKNYGEITISPLTDDIEEAAARETAGMRE